MPKIGTSELIKTVYGFYEFDFRKSKVLLFQGSRLTLTMCNHGP